MAPIWRKKDVQALLSSVNRHNTFETASREALCSSFSPSECREKFRELLTKPWTKEDNFELERMKNLVYSNPAMASVQLCRPMGSIQSQLGLLEERKRPPLCRFLEVNVTKEKPPKHVMLGLERERESLTSLMRGDDGVMVFGPGGCGKKFLLTDVARDLGLKLKSLTPPSTSREWYRNKKGYVADVFANLSKKSIIIVDDASLHQLGEHLIEFCAAGGKHRIFGAINCPLDFQESLLTVLFPKRLKIGLPNAETRTKMLGRILSENEIAISKDIDKEVWGKLLYGHTYSEIENFCELAASFRLSEQEDEVSLSSLREVSLDDFKEALDKVPRRALKEWNEKNN